MGKKIIENNFGNIRKYYRTYYSVYFHVISGIRKVNKRSSRPAHGVFLVIYRVQTVL